MFEKTTMPDPSYLADAILIAGMDANYSATYANGQMNYAATHYFNEDHGIDAATYLYPDSASNVSQIFMGANAGCAFINYTAHGTASGWSDPPFTVSHLNALTNTDKYFVGVGNSCLTNQFSTDVCFGEAFIRASDKAGVAYIGASNNTYWGEDYWWAIGYKTPIQAVAHAYNPSRLGAYDAMFHTHGEAFVNWGTTVAEANFMGNLAVLQSGSWLSNYYWEIYSIMGDPSLMPYYGVPTVNNASYPAQIITGASFFNVTAEPFSRVALSINGVLWTSGIVPSSGSLSLALPQAGRPRIARLVITAQNRITITDDIPIISNTGPQVVVGTVTFEDANNNLPEGGDNGGFTVSYSNLGTLAAENVVSTLSCGTPGITITDSVAIIPLISAGDSITVSAAFAFTIAGDVEEGTPASFTIINTCGSQSWGYQLSLEIMESIPAPVLSISASASGILLQWDALPQADQYHIFRASQALGPFAFLASTPDSYFLDSELPGKAFYFVKALRTRSGINEDN